jgi:hypothetical protein
MKPLTEMITDRRVLDAASLGGAGLATLLAVVQAVRAFRDRPVIRVVPTILTASIDSATEEYGTRFTDERGQLKEIFVEIEISNSGRRPVQIVSIFVLEENGRMQQIASENLPGGRRTSLPRSDKNSERMAG